MAERTTFIVGAYARVSSDRQAREGHSIEEQLQRAREECDRTLGPGGYELREYVDAGESGGLPPAQMLGDEGSPTRPRLTALLDDAAGHELDLVLFFSVDRLARDEETFHFTQRILRKHDVPFRFLDTDVDPTSEDGSLITGMLQLTAAHLRRQNRRRVGQGWRRRLAEGYPPGGTPPFGFQWQKESDLQPGQRRGYIRDEEEVRWAQWMSERYQAGWSTSRVAEELTRLGVPRPSGNSSKWDSNSVRKILIHPICAGLVRRQDGELIRGQHWEHRLWDREDREIMVKQLRRNRKLGATTINKAKYILNGILTCGHCSTRIYAGPTPLGRRQYLCRRKWQEGPEACPGLQKVAEPVEAAVVAAIRELSQTDDVQALTLEQVHEVLAAEGQDFQAQAERLRRELKAVNSKIDSLTDMRAAKELTQEQYVEQKDRLWEQRCRLEEQIAAVEAEAEDRSVRRVELAQIRETLQDFDRVWDALDDAEKRRACELVIEKAELRRDGDDVMLDLKVHYMPGRVLRLPNYNKRPEGEGVEALLPRQLAYLAHRRDGKSEAEIAEIWDVKGHHVYNVAKSVLGCLGTESIEKAIEMAAERIDAELHALPMEGRMRKRRSNTRFQWTDKRKRILRKLRRGEPRKGIAADMRITPDTLSERIRRMKNAAAVDTPEELVDYAVREGII